jgi:hypothetical protein
MNKPKEIVSADDDMVEGKLLQWADLDEVWDKYQLVELANFIRLAENAKNIEIDYQGWDAGIPGRSGTWHIITTEDEAALKGELRSIVAAFIWKERKKIQRILAEHRTKEEERCKRERERKLDEDDPEYWF